MTVSFTGISNLKISKKIGQDFGAYLGHDQEMKVGERQFEHVKYRFNLTDDKNGSDMKDLKDSFTKSGRQYYYDPQNPNQVELEVKRFNIDDDVVPITYSLLRMNGQSIAIIDKKDMILYTHLAKLVHKLGEIPNINPAQKKYTDFASQSIHDEALYFIDHVM